MALVRIGRAQAFVLAVVSELVLVWFALYRFGCTVCYLEYSRTLAEQQIAGAVRLVLHIIRRIHYSICMVRDTLMPNTSLEPTPVTPVSFRCGFRVGASHRRRGSVLGR